MDQWNYYVNLFQQPVLSLADKSEQSFPLIKFDPNIVCSVKDMASQSSETVSPIPYGKFSRLIFSVFVITLG
jgi:hypothetical protein